MITTVEVSRLRLYAYHGVFAQERTVGNEFEVSVALRLDVGDSALASDCLGVTVSYADMVEVIREVMAVPSHLLEHVAWRIREALFRRFGHSVTIAGGHVRVAKLTPPVPSAQMASASVTLEW